jgi:hypothetical protein
VDALANALDRVLFDEPFIAAARDNIRRVRERFYWEAVLQPLVEFVSNPSPAGDRRYGQGAAPRQPRKRKKRSGIRHDVSRVLYYLRNGGTSVVMAKFRNRLRRNR